MIRKSNTTDIAIRSTQLGLVLDCKAKLELWLDSSIDPNQKSSPVEPLSFSLVFILNLRQPRSKQGLIKKTEGFENVIERRWLRFTFHRAKSLKDRPGTNGKNLFAWLSKIKLAETLNESQRSFIQRIADLS